MVPRILVTGAGGLLGRACVAQGALGLARAQCDVTSELAMRRALDEVQPDAVLFCAAQSHVDLANSAEAWAVNVEAPSRWAESVPTWYVSSNYVFSGPGPHSAGAAVKPVQAYGEQKAAAEQGVLSAGGHVVRTGWLYGAGGTNFASSLPRALDQGPVYAISDIPVQPTYADDLAAFLMTLPRGLHHAIGREETTWYGFALAIASALGVRSDVRPVEVGALGLAAKRPLDARLSPAELPGWSERLEIFLAASR